MKKNVEVIRGLIASYGKGPILYAELPSWKRKALELHKISPANWKINAQSSYYSLNVPMTTMIGIVMSSNVGQHFKSIDAMFNHFKKDIASFTANVYKRPIILSTGKYFPIVDGYTRFLAYYNNGAKTIPALVKSTHHFEGVACATNS